MSKDIDISINSDIIVNSSEAIGSATQTNVLISAPVEVLNSKYTVSSSGLYSGSLLGGVPQWVDEAVAYSVTQNLVDIQNQLTTLKAYSYNEFDKVNKEISDIEDETAFNLDSEIHTTETDILAELHQKYSTTVTTDSAIAELDTTLTSQYKDYTNSSIAGLNQTYKTIADADEAIVTAKTELTSNFNNNISSALVQYQTKSTAESAESQIRTDLLTKVNDSVASLSEVYQTKIDATEASVSLTNNLTATFNTGLGVVSASIQTTEEVTAGYFSEYTDTSVDPKLGQFKLVDGVQYQYLGGYLGINSDGWVRTDQSAHDYTVSKTNYLTDLVNSQATVLQGQIDGSITTWFDIGSPEFDGLSATYQSDTNSTDDNSQDVITGNFIWSIADNQMFKYTGSDANIDLNSVDYVGSADWLAIYSISSKEKVWYDSDGIDTSNNYYWYEDSKICPLKDANTPAIIEERSKHIGDLYYDRNTGYAYRFAYEDIIDTPDEGVVFSWIIITDVDITKALSDAAKAQDTADGKRMIFNLDSVPMNIVGANSYTVKIDTGDLWVPNGDVTEDGVTYKDGRIYSYVKGHTPLWVEVANYKDAVNEVQTDLDNWRDGDYNEFVTTIQTQADMKSSSYYQEGMPHEEGTNEEYSEWVGDLWKKPSNNSEYIYQLVDGNYKWVNADVPDIVYDTIDTKKTIYTGNNTPNPSLPDKLENNDIWFTGPNPTDTQYTDKEIYTYNSSNSTWSIPVKYTDDTTANEAHGWAGSASKFITDPSTDAITGWSFGDGNGVSSEFKISADKFSLVNADGSASPLVVDATDPNDVQMKFTGTVTFGGSTDMGMYTNSILAADLANPSGTTVVDGGRLATNSIWVNGRVTSSPYDWNSGDPIGFNLTSAGDVDSGYGYNIIGGKIFAAQLASTSSFIVTDAGNLAKPIVIGYGSFEFEPTGASSNSFIYTTDIWANNSIEDTYARFSKDINNLDSRLDFELRVPSGDVTLTFGIIRYSLDEVYNTDDYTISNELIESDDYSVRYLEGRNLVFTSQITGTTSSTSTNGAFCKAIRTSSTSIRIILDTLSCPVKFTEEGVLGFLFGTDVEITTSDIIRIHPRGFNAMNI